jgi:CAAX protease family protein
VLMVWVYDRTESLLVAMLMHASFTGGVLYVLMPVAIAELSLVTWYVVLAAVLWLVVAAVAVANHGQLARQPLGRQAARKEVGSPPYVRPT